MSKLISTNKFYILLLLFLLAIQLLVIGAFPIIDTTEARYSGISLNMISSNNWQIPMLADNIPYLGKPPLVFWCQALSVKILGFNEFAFRFPFFLAGLLTLFFTYKIAKTYVDKKASILSVLVLFSSVMFFIESSTVSVDMFVTLFVTSTYYVFRKRSLSKNKNLAIYDVLLGITLTLGFLTKGLVPLIYFLCPFVIYSFFREGFRAIFSINWLIVGSVIFIVSAPWFVSVELAYPGFIKYFFYNEHFLRFVSKDYGDLYGAGHHFAPGMSWSFTFACIAPWVILLIPILINFYKKTKSEHLLLYLWAFFPALMFTPSKQILMAYFSVSIPPIAILIGEYLSTASLEVEKSKNVNKFLLPLIVTNIGALCGIGYFISRISKSFPNTIQIFPYIILFIISLAMVFIYRSTRNLYKPALLFILPVICMPIGCSLWFNYYFNSEETTRSTRGLVSKLMNLNKNYLAYPAEDIDGTLPYSFVLYRQIYLLQNINMISIHNNEKLVIVHDELQDELKQKYGSKYKVLVSDADFSVLKVQALQDKSLKKSSL